MKALLELLSVGLVLISGLLFVAGRKQNRFIASCWLLLGVALVLFLAGVTFTAQDKMMTMDLKLRAVTGLLSFFVLIATMEAVRRTQMRERYALLWLGIGLVILVFAIYPTATIAWLQKVTGMQYVTAIVVVIFGFLLLVTFHFSVEFSRLHDKLGRLTRRCALLERRIEELEHAVPRSGKTSAHQFHALEKSTPPPSRPA
ncbi:MAG: DUF2304 domain-containing protein [Verrucomicrobia bacterium]|nr:MAG: DUF2304 domain-containing protein [Verrucomicrobiota bacterium]